MELQLRELDAEKRVEKGHITRLKVCFERGYARGLWELRRLKRRRCKILGR